MKVNEIKTITIISITSIILLATALSIGIKNTAKSFSFFLKHIASYILPEPL